jgi:peptide deformylase
MIIKNLSQIGNKNLRKKSIFVSKINSKKVKSIIKDLINSLQYHNIVGLAAPQIGKNIRIFISEIKKTPLRNPKNTDKLRIYINPKIIWKSKKETIGFEGCGSVAYQKLFGPVKRSSEVIVEAINQNGEKFRLKTSGLLSRVIQHEYDHLNGILFTDKLTDIKKILSSEEYINKFIKR